MRYTDIFLLFIGIILNGLSILKTFPEWVIDIGLVSFIVMGIRLVVQGIKSKIAAIPPRPSIEDLKYQHQQKAEIEERRKFIKEEMKRYKQQSDTKPPDVQ